MQNVTAIATVVIPPRYHLAEYCDGTKPEMWEDPRPNYCPVLTGASLGAAFGADALDDSLLKHHPTEDIAEIKATAWGLAKLWRPEQMENMGPCINRSEAPVGQED